MLGKNEIKEFLSGIRHEYGICADADGDLAIVIYIQRKDCLLQAYSVKIKDLHPDYFDGRKFEDMCLKAAACWRPVSKMLRMPYDRGVEMLVAGNNIAENKENSN